MDNLEPVFEQLPPNPSPSPVPQPQQRSFKWIFVILAVLAVIFTGVYYYFILLKSRSKSEVCVQVITSAQNPQTGECRDFPTPCDVPKGWTKVQNCGMTPTSDPTANWKTYRNLELSFELKYPDNYKIIEESNNKVLIATDRLGSDGFWVSNDKDDSYVDLNKLRTCVVVLGEIERDDSGLRPPCLDVGKNFGQAEDVANIKLGGIEAISFYETSTGRGGTSHIIQTLGTPKIQLSIIPFPSNTIKTIDQILSTFKFLPETTPARSGYEVCAQVIAPARNPQTGECREFPTPCDVPQGWVAAESCNR